VPVCCELLLGFFGCQLVVVCCVLRWRFVVGYCSLLLLVWPFSGCRYVFDVLLFRFRLLIVIGLCFAVAWLSF